MNPGFICFYCFWSPILLLHLDTFTLSEARSQRSIPPSVGMQGYKCLVFHEDPMYTETSRRV